MFPVLNERPMSVCVNACHGDVQAHQLLPSVARSHLVGADPPLTGKQVNLRRCVCVGARMLSVARCVNVSILCDKVFKIQVGIS